MGQIWDFLRSVRLFKIGFNTFGSPSWNLMKLVFKSQDLSDLGPIWPNLGPILTPVLTGPLAVIYSLLIIEGSWEKSLLAGGVFTSVWSLFNFNDSSVRRRAQWRHSQSGESHRGWSPSMYVWVRQTDKQTYKYTN